MKTTQHTKLSTWLLWAPMKFALILFALTSVFLLLFSLAFSLLPTSPSNYIGVILIFIAFIAASAITIRGLPKTFPDRFSFISIHTPQTLIMALAFLTMTYLISQNTNQIIMFLLTVQTKNHLDFLSITLIFGTIVFYMYLIGVLISNMYLKFLRIRALNVPAWKIILSIPFGFSALWVPGYLLHSDKSRKHTTPQKQNWYSSAINWILSSPSKTIFAFIITTIISGFFFGFNMVALSFGLTLIFCLWLMQSGQKNFITHMPQTYSTIAIMFNIALIMGLILLPYIK